MFYEDYNQGIKSIKIGLSKKALIKRFPLYYNILEFPEDDDYDEDALKSNMAEYLYRFYPILRYDASDNPSINEVIEDIINPIITLSDLPPK